MSLLPGYSLPSPLLLAGAVSRPPFDRKNVRLFEYGRDAIAAYVGEHAEDTETLFAPSFVCEEATAGLERLGIGVHYYPIRESFAPDWDWLREQVDGQRQILLLVHYLGFANEIDAAGHTIGAHTINHPSWTARERLDAEVAILRETVDLDDTFGSVRSVVEGGLSRTYRGRAKRLLEIAS